MADIKLKIHKHKYKIIVVVLVISLFFNISCLIFLKMKADINDITIQSQYYDLRVSYFYYLNDYKEGLNQKTIDTKMLQTIGFCMSHVGGVMDYFVWLHQKTSADFSRLGLYLGDIANKNMELIEQKDKIN